MSSSSQALSLVDEEQIIREKVQKMNKVMNRAFFCFLFTISLFVMFNEGVFSINIPTDASINAAIMNTVAALSTGQTNLLTSGPGTKIVMDAQRQLDILNAARDAAKQLTITMWGYTHTPEEWIVMLRKVSPEYLGPTLDVITKILKMFYNLGCAGSAVMKDSYGVVMELSQGNLPLMEMARLQGYSNLFTAMTPFFAGFGLAYGTVNTAYKGILGESILGTITRVSSKMASACTKTSLSLLDMCLAVVLDTSGISGEDLQGNSPQESQFESQFESQPDSIGFSETSMGSSMYGDVDGISKLANMLTRQFTRDEISLDISRISTKSRESIQTFITAQTTADSVIQNPEQGNSMIAQSFSGLLRETRENITDFLNRSSETLGQSLYILFFSNKSCEPEQSYTEDSQYSAISNLTMETTCDPLMSLASVAESVEVDGAIRLVKQYQEEEGVATRSKRRRTGGKSGKSGKSGKGKKTKKTKKMGKRSRGKKNTKKRNSRGYKKR
jgi:hypothetical protein